MNTFDNCLRHKLLFLKNKQKNFLISHTAVSAVIGVILMVAITVAIAATVYVYVSGMIGGTTGTTATTISMNVLSTNKQNHQITWIVARVEGNEISTKAYRWQLLDENGQNYSDGTCLFNDNDNNSYINAGDTFSVNTSTSNKYVFTIKDTSTGSFIFRSVLKTY
jgi:FlaG/FlaF family flagellin (archaellin)